MGRSQSTSRAGSSSASGSCKMSRRRRVALTIGIVALFTWLVVFFGNSIAIAFESSTPSESLGSVSSGSLKHGKRLPTSGANFRAYSRLGAMLGRKR